MQSVVTTTAAADFLRGDYDILQFGPISTSREGIGCD